MAVQNSCKTQDTGLPGGYNQYFVDPVPIHVDYLEAIAFPGELLAFARYLAQIVDDETSHGLKTAIFVSREFSHLQHVFHIVDGNAAVDKPGTIWSLDEAALVRFRVRQLTYQSL